MEEREVVEKVALWMTCHCDRLPKWRLAMVMGGWNAPVHRAIGGFMERQGFC